MTDNSGGSLLIAVLPIADASSPERGGSGVEIRHYNTLGTQIALVNTTSSGSASQKNIDNQASKFESRFFSFSPTLPV